jgi:hypothetical protein
MILDSDFHYLVHDALTLLLSCNPYSSTLPLPDWQGAVGLCFSAGRLLSNGSFFWAFFHSSLSPNVEFAAVWPPIAIHPVSRAIPLLGSCL